MNSLYRHRKYYLKKLPEYLLLQFWGVIRQLAILLILSPIVAFASQWQILASRDNETIVNFIDVNTKSGSHTLTWIKTLFAIPKSVAIDGEKRRIVNNHSNTVSAWDIDCELRTGKLIYHLAYTTDGSQIQEYSINSFAIDFLGVDDTLTSTINVSKYRRLDGKLKDIIIDRSCN
jgi:hypothetical protein